MSKLILSSTLTSQQFTKSELQDAGIISGPYGWMDYHKKKYFILFRYESAFFRWGN